MLLFALQLLFCQDTRNQHFARKATFQTTAYVHTYGTALARIRQNPHQARAAPRTRTPLPDLPSTGQSLLHATYHSHHNQLIHPPHTCNPEFTNPALPPTSFVLLTTITTKTHSLHNSNTPRTHATHALPIPPNREHVFCLLYCITTNSDNNITTATTSSKDELLHVYSHAPSRTLHFSIHPAYNCCSSVHSSYKTI